MLIAHLPAGYLMVKGLFSRSQSKAILWMGLLGAVTPDLDMLRFWFLDNKQFHHHSYWTHKPLPWLGIFLATLLFLRLTNRKQPTWLYALFCGLLLHLLLDTIAGDIRWLWPFSNDGFHLVTVTATHSHWVASFMAHWTFKLEIAVWLIAALVFGFKKNA